MGILSYTGTGTLFLTGNNVNWNKTNNTSFGLVNVNNGTVNATTASLNGATSTSGNIIFGHNQQLCHRRHILRGGHGRDLNLGSGAWSRPRPG